ALTAQKGELHIWKNGKMECTTKLPFNVSLSDFEVENYPGTDTPKDFISDIVITDHGKTLSQRISMNHIVKYKNYRLYQNNYDPDLQGSVLSVNYDPWGISFTYLGYILLLISIILALFKKNGYYRSLFKKTTAGMLLLIVGISLSAQPTLTKEEATSFGNLAMLYQGRVAPVSTYACDFTLKLYNTTDYKDFTAEQVLAGWIFYPEEWEKSYDFSETDLNIKTEKMETLMGLLFGTSLKIFPKEHQWYAPADDLRGLSSQDTIFIGHVLQLLAESVHAGQHDDTKMIIDKMAVYQNKNAAERSVSAAKLKTESFFNHFQPLGWLYKINLFFAGLVLLMLFWKKMPKKFKIGLNVLVYIQLIHSFAFLTLIMGLRWYISGHIPLSNGYETVLFATWIMMLATLFFAKKQKILLLAGFLLSGVTLMMLSMGVLNPQINSLMPVLHSPWLIVHVSVIMISYALFAFTFILAIIALIAHFRAGEKALLLEQKLTNISKILLFPGIALLSIGIFIGAVWANITWGRYWGWDPKEVWALITLMVYGVTLFDQSLPFLQKKQAYHLYLIFAFLFVLMTYLGVNVLMGGVHSYQG
ncbi:MAG: cytochrome c biogenesis protein CcsA, partial [Bacteroidales bacterium]|nr:cytochrome c biogenesis protein CcsA [Bacteroidales bacterium]